MKRLGVHLLLLFGIMVGNAAQTVRLAEGGKALLPIVIPAQATEAEKNAAQNLQYWLKRITGAEFAIHSGADAWEGARIGIGMKHFADLEEQELRLLPGADGSLDFAGDAEAAVWMFLEEELGCRWYTPEAEKIPVLPELAVILEERRSVPDFRMRFVYTDYGLCASPEWTARNRVMAWNYFNHIDGWFCHTYEAICSMTESAEHPEYFARQADGTMFNTQLCPTHPEIQQRAVAGALKALRANDKAEAYLLSVTENDGSTGYCQCDRCREVIARYRAPIAPHLLLVNAVAVAVREEFPAVRVEFLVYSRDFRQPPEGLTLEPNVAMWYCATDFNHRGMAASFRSDPAGRANFERWRAMVPEAHVWEYNCDYSNYFRVVPTLPAKLDNLRYWEEHDIDGVFALEVFGHKGGDQQALRAWVMAKMMWDSALEPDVLARDFLRRGLWRRRGAALSLL